MVFLNKKNAIIYITALILLLTILMPIQNSYSASAARDRFRTCTPEGDPTGGNSEALVRTQSLEGMFGDDLEVETGNSYCGTRVLVYYWSLKGLIATMNAACGSGDPVPRPLPSPLQDVVDIGKASYKQTKDHSGKCTAAYVAVMTFWAPLTADLLATNLIAKQVFENSRVCGSNWMRHDSTTMLKSIDSKYKMQLARWIEDPDNVNKLNYNTKEYREWNYGGMEREYEGCRDPTRPLIDGKRPPQRYYFRGTLPGIYNCERYNVRDLASFEDPLASGGNKGLSPARLKEYRDAYNCCINKSRKSICIEYNSDNVLLGEFADISQGDPDGKTNEGYYYKFCEGDKRCTIKGIEFMARSLYNDTMICAESYSLCPYNFNLQGGTISCQHYEDTSSDGKMIDEKSVKEEKCSGKSEIRKGNCELNDKAGKCRNYCQIMEHCVIVDNNNYTYTSGVSSPYFSEACINFIGDSQNTRGFDTGLFAGNQKQFSAPIAQCVRETVENIFFNKAGHSRCRNPSEVPDRDGNCYSEQYLYQKGSQILLEKDGKVFGGNFFGRMQEHMIPIIQLVLMLSVMLTGFKVLAGNQGALRKKELIPYIVKIGLIMYFVTGTAWQTTFFNGIYKASEVASTVVFKVTVPSEEDKRDGCQFGDLVDKNENAVNVSPQYPKGSEYIAVWDTMDCKIARYLGMGSNLSSASIAKLILASFFTGTYGIWFALLLSIFGIFMVVATIKMLHIFLASAMSIIILVYVSFITIPLVLFSKTKSIFSKWFTNLVSLSVQPIILFAYIGLYIAIFDHILIGNGTFSGAAPEKTIDCKSQCFDISGNKKKIPTGKTAEDICDVGKSEILIDPMTDSVACIIGSKSESLIGNWPGLELIGISVPVIKSIFTNDGRKKLKKQIITLLKAALLVYVLSKFIDQIPKIATSLVGGAQLKMTGIDGIKTFNKINDFLNGEEKEQEKSGSGKSSKYRDGGAIARARRGATKLAKRAAGGTEKLAKGAGSALGNKGKSSGAAKSGNSTSDSVQSGGGKKNNDSK